MKKIIDIIDYVFYRIYDVSGKIVYTASATDGLDAFPNTISSGMYVAIVASKEGQEIASKKIVIP